MVVHVTRLPSLSPAVGTTATSPTHHVGGSPPTSFSNPWPSFDHSRTSGLNVFKTKFARDRPAFVPVPADRSELVQVRTPTWGRGETGLKATWIGHAGFLLETTSRALLAPDSSSRGVRILCDPVFSERTSPVGFLGPKRYTPLPCPLADVPEVDAVIISHNHYDHLDLHTIKALHARRKRDIHFFAPLGNAAWFHGLGIPADQVTELDWWDAVVVQVEAVVGTVRLVCTPSQHLSGRTLFDRCCTLWCSWCILEEEEGEDDATSSSSAKRPAAPPTKRVFFSGDTGYRSLPSPSLTRAEQDALPHCPTFSQVGHLLGPFDLALLPIGLCTPRVFMSPVHCDPWDSISLHRDVRSKKSIGMHYGTFRGGISQEYEDVRSPPQWWRMAAEEAGLSWGRDKEIALVDIGETVVV